MSFSSVNSVKLDNLKRWQQIAFCDRNMRNVYAFIAVGHFSEAANCRQRKKGISSNFPECYGNYDIYEYVFAGMIKLVALWVEVQMQCITDKFSVSISVCI